MFSALVRRTFVRYNLTDFYMQIAKRINTRTLPSPPSLSPLLSTFLSPPFSLLAVGFCVRYACARHAPLVPLNSFRATPKRSSLVPAPETLSKIALN